MTAHEMEELSKLIAEKVAKHPPHCLVFSPETVATLNGFAKLLNQGKRTAWVTLVTLTVTAIIGYICIGFVVKLKTALGL